MTRWRSRWTRLRDFVLRTRLERDIDDEIRFHVETEIEAGLHHGLSEEDARRAAHHSLGGTPLLVRERIHDARGVSLADDFRADFRQGMRRLRRAPGVTAVVVGTLAIAIGSLAFGVAGASRSRGCCQGSSLGLGAPIPSCSSAWSRY